MEETHKAFVFASLTQHRIPVSQQSHKREKDLSTWVRESASLKKQSSLLERELWQRFYSTRSDLRQTAEELLEMEKADAEERRVESEQMRKRLETQKVALSEVVHWLQCFAEGKPTDVPNNIEDIMGALEDDLYGFKCNMRDRYNELSVHEESLSAEVDSFRGMVKEWEKGVRGELPVQRGGGIGGGSGNKGTRAEAALAAGGEVHDVGDNSGMDDVDRGTLQGYAALVERINDLIAREGGATGGWPLHEHEGFLRIWTKVKKGPLNGARPPTSSPAKRAAVSMLVQRASTLLPGRGPHEIKEHLAWHERHSGYLEEKKRLAKAWREARQRHQEKEAHDTPEDDRCAESPGQRNRREASTAREVEARKKKVEEWRAAKEAEEKNRVDVERRKRAEEAAMGEEARMRQRKMREQVAAYRLEREREDARRVEVERMLAKEQRVHSQVNLDERMRRGVENARRRCQDIKEKEGQRQALEEKRKLTVSEKWKGVAADRARLMSATKAMKERVLGPEDLDHREDARASLPAHNSRIALAGRDLRYVGRAVPVWRRNACP